MVFRFRLVEKPLEVGPAPAATRPRAETLAQLPRAANHLDADEVDQFPLGDPETEADFVVEVHAVTKGDSATFYVARCSASQFTLAERRATYHFRREKTRQSP